MGEGGDFGLKVILSAPKLGDVNLIVRINLPLRMRGWDFSPARKIRSIERWTPVNDSNISNRIENILIGNDGDRRGWVITGAKWVSIESWREEKVFSLINEVLIQLLNANRILSLAPSHPHRSTWFNPFSCRFLCAADQGGGPPPPLGPLPKSSIPSRILILSEFSKSEAGRLPSLPPPPPSPGDISLKNFQTAAIK